MYLNIVYLIHNIYVYNILKYILYCCGGLFEWCIRQFNATGNALILRIHFYILIFSIYLIHIFLSMSKAVIEWVRGREREKRQWCQFQMKAVCVVFFKPNYFFAFNPSQYFTFVYCWYCCGWCCHWCCCTHAKHSSIFYTEIECITLNTDWHSIKSHRDEKSQPDL